MCLGWQDSGGGDWGSAPSPEGGRHGLRGVDGLPPRVRGNRGPQRRDGVHHRSSPACAGEPCTCTGVALGSAVYPRVCGGSHCPRRNGLTLIGLSPLARGNQYTAHLEVCPRGLSPREPRALMVRLRESSVYPRVCGGTPACRRPPPWSTGLSPRVRGNPQPSQAQPAHPGSIPACAGEPGASSTPIAQTAVYPRACGGTLTYVLYSGVGKGLSPRVRGNPSGPPWERNRKRSIPARAGEPPMRSVLLVICVVYPRACGGTDSSTFTAFNSTGLSPRVRGNPPKGHKGGDAGGSIPARAGEPLPGMCQRSPLKVYPRACGGTPLVRPADHPFTPLSPRVRGNPRRLHRGRVGVRSIPARAGEPRTPVATS